ncbi:hypothetical protein CDO26_35595 (plasmid) [Sinorhizobium meliloti]|nr:hypothetical protein CDO26_35595 [Sinorhizobium meliloti]
MRLFSGPKGCFAIFAGLAPTPWQSGTIDHEQGVSKAGNPRLRTTWEQVGLREQAQPWIPKKEKRKFAWTSKRP